MPTFDQGPWSSCISEDLEGKKKGKTKTFLIEKKVLNTCPFLQIVAHL